MTQRNAYLAVMLSAAGIFALTMGIRQSQALFISPINSSTGLGIGEISFAFAVAQLMWGVTQPFAGAAFVLQAVAILVAEVERFAV